MICPMLIVVCSCAEVTTTQQIREKRTKRAFIVMMYYPLTACGVDKRGVVEGNEAGRKGERKTIGQKSMIFDIYIRKFT